jgi:hypothetical protein
MFKTGLKLWLVIIGIFLVLSILIFIGKVILFPAHVVNSAVDGAYNIVTKTLDADNIIYNYEWFKQEWEDYKAISQKVETAEKQKKSFNDEAGTRDKWTFEDKNEYSRLSSILQGLQNQRNDLVATYNARSKMVNRSIFKQGVPNQIEQGQ